MRAIDADKLGIGRANPTVFVNEEYAKGWNAVIDILEQAPTLSPDDVRGVGEWVDMGDFEQCSVCKGTHLKEFQSKYGKTTWIRKPYCPNCGAKMEVSKDA